MARFSSILRGVTRVHLVDATYELFRAHFAMPPLVAPDGRAVSAVRGLLMSLLSLCRVEGATHVACATDHVIRSFRNDLYAGYKIRGGRRAGDGRGALSQ
jgi:5'-3' exonuclease